MSKEGFLDLEKFEKKKRIGKGSFGKVYIVEEKGTQQIYAAKVAINKIDKNSPKEMLSISREVNIISKLQHPAILKFIGYSPIDFNKKSKPVIITEYSTNGSLGNILELEKMNKKIKGWDLTKKLICIYGIAKGMEYLHSHDIIHRDLKPDNIFMDDYLLPKIADFGLSKINNNNDISISINDLKTTTGTIKGTPIYIAPEIWSSQKYTTSSDVYAFSLIVYEIITNEQPFKGYSMIQILMEISKKGKRPEFNKNVPDCFQNLIKNCWSQSPENRPSFKEIAEQLKTDPNFITKDIVKDDFYKYIEFIDQSQSTFDSTRKIIHISDYISKNKTFQKVKIKKHKKTKDDQSSLKIIEEEKIVEIDEKVEDENKLKIIDQSIYKNLNYSSKKLILEAEENKEDSLIIVAQNFLSGSNNFPKDTDTGIKYLEYGISVDNVAAMELFGKILFDGEIIEKNEDKSVEILTKAADEFNSPNAKYELANIILSHQSFDVDDKNDDINYVLAKKYSKEAADSGHVKAMVQYSKLSSREVKNKFGKIKYNNGDILKYRKLAADNNDPEGLALYGRYIEFGNYNMKPNPNEAIKYYQRAYKLNDMTGCVYLAFALYDGIGDLEKNVDSAAKLLKLASDNNNPLGTMYYHMLITKDMKAYFEACKKFAALGDPVGYCLTGLCYRNANGIERDLNMSIKYFLKGIEQGSFICFFHLGDIYTADHPEFGIKKNVKKASKYLKYAADNGIVGASNQYAQLLANLGENPETIKKYLFNGINMGDTNCMISYSCLLINGIGLPQDFNEAVKYSKMAADLGDKNGMKIYASLLNEGLGVNKDQQEAVQYNMLSKDQTNEECLIQ